MQLPLGVSRLASKRRYRQTGQRLSRKLLFDSRDMVFWATPSTIPEVSYLSPTTDAEISLSWAEPGSMLSRSRYFGESMHAAARLYQMDQCLYSTAGTTFNVQVSFQYLHGFNPPLKILLPG